MPQKRKFEDDDEEQNVKPKIVKVEPEGNTKKIKKYLIVTPVYRQII